MIKNTEKQKYFEQTKIIQSLFDDLDKYMNLDDFDDPDVDRINSTRYSIGLHMNLLDVFLRRILAFGIINSEERKNFQWGLDDEQDFREIFYNVKTRVKYTMLISEILKTTRVTPRFICKHNNKYFEWSTSMDAIVTEPMTLSRFKEYYLLEYGRASTDGLNEKLKRVEQKGTSSLLHESIDELIPKEWLEKVGKQIE